MRVAVLGAGLLGVCTALELARRGVRVDLYDRNERLLSQAATRNEGKIHLGFVYANAPFATAERMVAGGLRFLPLLRRWLGSAADRVSVSDQFTYVVHRESLLDADAFRAHAARVERLLAQAGEGVAYPGGRWCAATHTLSAADMGATYDDAVVQAAVRTPERSVAVAALAALLRQAVDAEPLIVQRLGVEVVDATRGDDELEVHGVEQGQRCRGRYTQVVNALWDGRLALDARLGLRPRADWLWRLRYAIFIRPAPPAAALPTFTAVLGPFGDVARLSDGGVYLSWYPACLGGLASGSAAPTWPREPTDETARAVVAASIDGLATIAPAVGGLRAVPTEAIDVKGGIIFAHGRTDIDDPASGLHRRDRIGITSQSGWHSVDPGKYSLAPAFAYDVAERVKPLQ